MWCTVHYFVLCNLSFLLLFFNSWLFNFFFMFCSVNINFKIIKICLCIHSFNLRTVLKIEIFHEISAEIFSLHRIFFIPCKFLTNSFVSELELQRLERINTLSSRLLPPCTELTSKCQITTPPGVWHFFLAKCESLWILVVKNTVKKCV